MGEINEIEEKAENVVGWFNSTYVIAAPADDDEKRKYCVYNLYNIDNPSETAFAYIPPPHVKREEAEFALNSTLRVLKTVSGLIVVIFLWMMVYF